jgi:NADPH-dependent glutamate synthase beta subunit-like oxidoreductase
VSQRVVVVGAGPAGLAVASALLAQESIDIAIDLVDRNDRPDSMLRHGPIVGAVRLREVATYVDALVTDSRVTFYGGIDVGTAVPWDALRRAADAVVLATGPPRDDRFDIAVEGAVGMGTLSHVDAWLAGSPDA